MNDNEKLLIGRLNQTNAALCDWAVKLEALREDGQLLSDVSAMIIYNCRCLVADNAAAIDTASF